MAQLHVRIHRHEAIQFVGLKVTLAANIAASSLLDKPRTQELLDAIVDMPDGDGYVTATSTHGTFWVTVRSR
jgi:hypothetical protein